MDTGLVSEKYKPIIRSFLTSVSDDLSMVLEWAEGRQGEILRQIASGHTGSLVTQRVREGLVKWGIKMNLKRVLLELSVPDVQEILAIDLDGDADKALAFFREKVAKKVKNALQSH